MNTWSATESTMFVVMSVSTKRLAKIIAAVIDWITNRYIAGMRNAKTAIMVSVLFIRCTPMNFTRLSPHVFLSTPTLLLSAANGCLFS